MFPLIITYFRSFNCMIRIEIGVLILFVFFFVYSIFGCFFASFSFSGSLFACRILIHLTTTTIAITVHPFQHSTFWYWMKLNVYCLWQRNLILVRWCKHSDGKIWNTCAIAVFICLCVLFHSSLHRNYMKYSLISSKCILYPCNSLCLLLSLCKFIFISNTYLCVIYFIYSISMLVANTFYIE